MAFRDYAMKKRFDLSYSSTHNTSTFYWYSYGLVYDKRSNDKGQAYKEDYVNAFRIPLFIFTSQTCGADRF